MRSSLFAVAAAVLATAAVLSYSSEASAAITVTGAKTYGQTFSKSSYSGDFGASFEAGGKVYANDYDALCRSTDPALCGSTATGAGLFCTMFNRPLHDIYCARNIGTKMGFGAVGGAEAEVRLFDKDLEIFDFDADARIEPNAISTGYGISVAGLKLSGGRYGASYSRTVTLAERTLVQASSTFMLGPIPITVKAQAVGSLGMDLNLSAGTATASASVEPFAEVDGVFSAGVGVSTVSVGIEGELMLARVGIPATATLTWNGGKSFSYDASLDLAISTLDGSVNLYAEGFGKRADWEITSWDGLSWTYNLGHKNGSFSL